MLTHIFYVKHIPGSVQSATNGWLHSFTISWCDRTISTSNGSLGCATVPNARWLSRQWRRLLSQKSPKHDNESDLRAPSATSTRHLSTTSSLTPQRGRSPTSSIPQDAVRRLSQISPLSSYRHRSPEPDRRLADTLGLQVIYQPSSAAPIDIVFVHGLGGASSKTWSKYQDPHLFWPQQWLPLEPEICTARILSFGYNASFRPGGPRNIANIADFAKDLLFEMRFGKDDNTEDLGIGRVGVESVLGFKHTEFRRFP